MGKVVYITEDQKNKIVEMYFKGYKKVEIAKELNISTQSVTKYLVKNNIKQKPHFLSEEIKMQICDLYQNNKMPINQIQRELGVDYMTIRRVFNKYNIKTRSISESNRKYDLNENYFDEINTQNKAYILGLLYADGNVTKNKYAMQLSLQEDDKHILDEIKNELKTDIPLYYKERHDHLKNVYCLIINNMHMHQALINKGVIPQKTFFVQYPDFLDKNLIRHFIRGYFDGDGCFYYGKRKDRKNSYHALFSICGTVYLCNGIKNILENELGVHCRISYCHNKTESPIRSLTVSGTKNVQKVLDWLYEDAEMYLKRKHNKYLDYKKIYNSSC